MGGAPAGIYTTCSPNEVQYIIEHAEAPVILVENVEQWEKVNQERDNLPALKWVVMMKDGGVVDDPMVLSWEDFLSKGDGVDAEFVDQCVKKLDPHKVATLIYTSGTTGMPKGVLYHSRGAYLAALGEVLESGMTFRTNYLWTLPMFHCNGWCYTWTMSMLHGRVICLRNIDVKKIFELIDKYDVTHFGGAPIVLNMIANAPKEHQKKLKRKIHVLTAGAPPPSIIFEKMQNLGFDVMHVYGLTETYGHMLQCAWNDEWNDLEQDKKNEIKARQGVRYPNTEGAVVMDPETMKPVPHDGKTMGEIMIRGNIVMKGYYKDKEATEKAMKGGWFHSGDLAVTHPNGYIKIQDRSKDIIISGGENISSIEIENVLYQHPEILEAAVVARPDEKWGETPCAFVVLKSTGLINEQEVIKFCRTKLAGFKIPRNVVFSELPKTSTGKIRKSVLREQAKQL